MSRRRRFLLAGAVAAVLFVALAVLVLPEATRRLAESQLTALFGRATRIERVEMNLFTGRVAVIGARVAEAAGPDAFVTIDRIEAWWKRWSLTGLDVRFHQLVIRAPRVRVVRIAPDRFNFSDLVDRLATPESGPARFTFTFDHLVISDGEVAVDDRAVAPVADWSIQRFQAEGRGITTDGRRAPGTLTVSARMGDAAVEIAQDVVKLQPMLLVGRVAITGFDLARLGRYVPRDAPAFAEAGIASVKLNMVWKREPGRVDTAYANGLVTADGLTLSQPERPQPFLRVKRAEAQIEQADLIAQSLTFASLTLHGFDGRAVRDRLGRIDLLLSPEAARLGEEAAAALAAGAPPEGVGTPGESGVWRVRVERLSITEARAVLDDQAVAPPREWRLDDFTAEGHGLSSVAGDPPGRLTARARLVTTPAERRRQALAGSASLGLDVTVAREAARPDAPIIAGLVSIDGLAWTREGRRAPVLAVDKASARFARVDPVARELDIGDLRVEGIDGAAVRSRDGAIDVVDELLAALLPASPGAAPAPAELAPRQSLTPGQSLTPATPGPTAVDAAWRVRLEQAAVTARRLELTDHTVSPPREVKVDRLSISARGLSTERSDPPAQLKLSAEVTSPGSDRPARLAVDADRLRVLPIEANARLQVGGYDLRSLALLWPADVPIIPTRGLVDLDTRLTLLEDDTHAVRSEVGGRVRLSDLAMAPRPSGAELVEVPRLEIVVKKADALAGTVDLERLEIDRPLVRVARDAGGDVDLLAVIAAFQERATAGAAPAAAEPPRAARPLLAALTRALTRPWRVSLDRLALSGGAGRFDDALTQPRTQLEVAGIALDVERLTWPTASPATFKLSADMPGGGRSVATGHVQLEPLDIQLATETRDAPIEPYQAYFPFPARFSGRFNGDSLSEVQRGPDGVLVLASRGSAWGDQLDIRAPGADAHAARVERLEIRGIDFSWPNYAIVERIALVRPNVSVERDRDGAINLRTLFTPTPSPDGIPAKDTAGRDWTLLIRPADEEAERTPGRPPREEGPLLETIVLDFEELAIEEGSLRFLDRSTSPPMSQDLSAFHLTIKGLSNVLGRRRTTLAARGMVDGEGRLDLRGEASGIGEALRIELVGDLKDFPLASANPYAQTTGWIVERGKLAAKIHYRVEGDRLIAEHDLLVSGLAVEKARATDEVQRTIGLPLGLIVALLKDSGGDIDFTVPVKGSIGDRTVDWGETYWSGIKQALLKLLVGPFRAIGRVVTGRGGDTVQALAVEPVSFAAGSAVIAPAMETHVTRVGDFLRRSPYLKLKLTPVATAADLDSLKGQEVMARVQAFQRERQLTDFSAAVRDYFATRGLPGPPPRTAEEQLAALRRAEPEPTARVTELLDRRLAATRQALTSGEGIPAERVVPATPEVRRDAADPGRVEFQVAAE